MRQQKRNQANAARHVHHASNNRRSHVAAEFTFHLKQRLPRSVRTAQCQGSLGVYGPRHFPILLWLLFALWGVDDQRRIGHG